MKALCVLGAGSNSGKSWLATALCAWLKQQGLRVTPFKAQNMSNNSYVTWDGGEIGRAQAVQAQACGLLPQVEMNPVLLKPSGQLGAQLVLLGQAQGHVKALDYYDRVEPLWETARAALDGLLQAYDVVVVEGAGSPVELNLMARDIANLRPLRHADGRWILVADIERGGVFPQIIGTYQLLPPADRARGLGIVVNKFRGDPRLFDDAGSILAGRVPVPYLGLLPYDAALQPESEDSLCAADEASGSSDAPLIAWIRFPHISNSSDIQPWRLDGGVHAAWVDRPAALQAARAIVLPGSKNTVADLSWLRDTGLAHAITAKASRRTPVVGICGGYQMLGETINDPEGVAGDSGVEQGLGLLPLRTVFARRKQVTQVRVRWGDEGWDAYEIHMGLSEPTREVLPLLAVERNGERGGEGVRQGAVWGTYLHGLFESAAVRSELAALAGLTGHIPAPVSWTQHQRDLFERMAAFIDVHLDLRGVLAYVEH